jgi:hypothetical protein
MSDKTYLEIIEALTLLAFGTPMTLKEFTRKETEHDQRGSATENEACYPSLGVKVEGVALATGRICAAAAKADGLKIFGRRGRGSIGKGSVYHADFDPPEAIPATAFINAEIRYCNPSHLFNPPVLPPTWYHLMLEREEFLAWLNTSHIPRVPIPALTKNETKPSVLLAHAWLLKAFPAGYPEHFRVPDICAHLNKQGFGKIKPGKGTEKVSVEGIKRALGRRT